MFGERLTVRIVRPSKKERVLKVSLDKTEVEVKGLGTFRIDPNRVFNNAKGKPTIQFGPSDASAWSPFVKGEGATPQEWREGVANNYIQQVMSLLRSGLDKATPWLVIGVVIFAAFIGGVLDYQSMESVDKIAVEVARLRLQIQNQTATQPEPGGF